MRLDLASVVAALGGELYGDASLVVTGLAPLRLLIFSPSSLSTKGDSMDVPGFLANLRSRLRRVLVLEPAMVFK